MILRDVHESLALPVARGQGRRAANRPPPASPEREISAISSARSGHCRILRVAQEESVISPGLPVAMTEISRWGGAGAARTDRVGAGRARHGPTGLGRGGRGTDRPGWGGAGADGRTALARCGRGQTDRVGARRARTDGPPASRFLPALAATGITALYEFVQ